MDDSRNASIGAGRPKKKPCPSVQFSFAKNCSSPAVLNPLGEDLQPQASAKAKHGAE